MRFSDRRRRALRSAREPILVTDPTNVRYLTGFTGSNAQLLLADTCVFITDGRYQTQAAEQVPDCQRVIYEQNAAVGEVLRELLAGSGVQRLVVEAGHLTVEAHRRLAEGMPDVDLIASTGLVEANRRIKEAEEIQLIREAQRVAEQAVVSVMDTFTGGTERDLSLELEWAVRTGGGEEMAFEVIVASGAHSAHPHARPRSVPIPTDEVLLVDIGARCGGYCSDMTRTWTYRAPDPMPRVHAAVVRALEEALAAIRPGVKAADVDRAARNVLHDEGFADQFVHSTGHSVGMDIHEAPRLSSNSDDVLESGMVLTVEPGVYLPGVGGVRVEDLIVVTDRGFENLTSLPRDPV